MTTATELLAAAQTLSVNKHDELHAAWIAASPRFAAVAGTFHWIAFQANGRLDILLRQLERESLEFLRLPFEEQPLFFIDQLSLLSEAWLFNAYEMVRAAGQQIRERKIQDNELDGLKHRLGLVRMPLAKAEIQKAKPKSLVLINADGGNPKLYEADGSYIMPRGMCEKTGSFCWTPVDMRARASVLIRRRDLADELLAWSTKLPLKKV